jgi:hypothetical protein
MAIRVKRGFESVDCTSMQIRTTENSYIIFEKLIEDNLITLAHVLRGTICNHILWYRSPKSVISASITKSILQTCMVKRFQPLRNDDALS